jgi:hypothetical protein
MDDREWFAKSQPLRSLRRAASERRLQLLGATRWE